MKLKTPIVYYGGKQTMLKHIRPLIPAHSVYIESFAGGAAVFFDKTPVKVNVINDLNGELINFYKTVISDYEELKKGSQQNVALSRTASSRMVYLQQSGLLYKCATRMGCLYFKQIRLCRAAEQ